MPVTVRAAFAILYCDDLPRALGFYRDLLGMEVGFAYPPEGEPGFVSLTLGDCELALADVRGQETGTHGLAVRPRGGQRFEVCLRVDDVDAAVAEWRGAGVPVLVEPTDQPWGERLAYVQDPEGNPVMLYAEL